MDDQRGSTRFDLLDLRCALWVALTYLGAATLWIVLSGIAADSIASRTDVSVTVLEVGKGLGFVLVTAGVLYQSLRRWVSRLQRAAATERDAADRLRNAEQMRATLLAGLSHEMRTPLTAIVGYAETLENQADLLAPDTVEHLASRLVVNGERLERLIVDLLELDRLMNGMGTLRSEPVDITALAAQIVDTCNDGSHRIELVGEPSVVMIDAPKVERMLHHLIDNALRHTAEGTTVTVRVGMHGDDLELKVEDDGPGLPDELIGRIFDPFVQDDSAVRGHSPGIGIGLALVAQFAALHDGTVTAENVPGSGARFTVVLPACGQPVAALRSAG